MKSNVFLKLKEQATTNFGSCGFRVILYDEFEYESAREISNSYFDKKPRAVAFPRNARQVQECIQFCIDHDQTFRTRSGGHQHEGMSSLNGGLMIRLSDMSLIQYEEENVAWIDSGMKLGTVYAELAHHEKIIPGGGCFTVNVGGLTQGGGWGMHARQHGLTCDSVLAIEIVLYNEPDCTKVEIVSPEYKPELFRALKGGGGGNFGIVTRFKFALKKLEPNVTRFRFGWKASETEKVVKKWLDVQSKLPKELTTFVRLSVMQEDAPGDGEEKPRARDYPIYAGGLFYGTKDDLVELEEMKSLMNDPAPDQQEWEPREKPSKRDSESKVGATVMSLFGYDDFSEALHHLDMNLQSGSAAEDPKQRKCNVTPPSANCNIPHPHKVSSAFPTSPGESYNERLTAAVTKYMQDSRFDPNVRSYMTFHAMGGKIASKEPSENRTFAYSDKDFLMQFQSWWNYPDDKVCKDKVRDREQKYIRWVRDFRKTLDEKGLVEGAFINFVDKDLATHSTPPSDDKTDLLNFYYAHELPGLRKVKKDVDPKNIFNFEMSIPPA